MGWKGYCDLGQLGFQRKGIFPALGYCSQGLVHGAGSGFLVVRWSLNVLPASLDRSDGASR